MNPADTTPPRVDCDTHGRGVAAVVCCHMLQTADRVVGFVENSDDPNDLQAWCDACEALFQQEDGLTDAFRHFNDMRIVCTSCYAALKARHSPLPDPDRGADG